MITPLAVNTFDFRTLIISRYVSGAWTDPEIFATAVTYTDPTIDGFKTFSAGSLSASLVSHRGAIALTLDAQPDANMQFLGAGAPDTPYNIVSSDLSPGFVNQPVINTYFNASTGAWFYNSKWWIFTLEHNGGSPLYAMFSCVDPSSIGSWSYEDAGDGPSASFGACIQYDPAAGIIYLFTYTGRAYNYAVYDFNFTTESGPVSAPP